MTTSHEGAHDAAAGKPDPFDEFLSLVDGLRTRGAARGGTGTGTGAGGVVLTEKDLQKFEAMKAAMANLRVEGGRRTQETGHTLNLGLADLRLIFRALCGCCDDRDDFKPQGPKGNVTEVKAPPPPP